jgi:hypothetical protein
MASRTTLNAKNLEALGAAALAELLLDISKGSAPAKQRLRLALAGEQGPVEAGAEIGKRLALIGRARTRVTWRRRKALVVDLQTQLAAICHQVLPSDPALGVDLLWRFVALADPVFDRCEDRTGEIAAVFEAAISALGAGSVGMDTGPMADRVFEALCDNGYGQFDGLIPAMAEALGPGGLAAVKGLLAGAKVPRGGLLAQRQIADAGGDVDAFIASYPAGARALPAVAAEIAGRLIEAGRAEEALAVLDRVDAKPDGGWVPVEWQDSRIAALEALGRGEAAQEFRWACFARSLSAPHLRDYLKRLPDFDDMEAEEKALALAAGFSNAVLALNFLVHWNALPEAAAVALARQREMDGEFSEILIAASERLADRFPLAAMVLLRVVIDWVLRRARSGQYGQAAALFAECARLDAHVADHGEVASHAKFAAWVNEAHGRKIAFWAALAKLGVR